MASPSKEAGESTRMTIVFLNMSLLSDWRKGIVNRNFHVVRRLAENPIFSNVILVDSIPHSTMAASKRIAKRLVENRKISFSQQVRRELFNNVHVWRVRTHRFNQIGKQIHHIKKGRGQFVIWSFNPFFTPLFNDFPEAIKVFDTVDNWAEHQVYQRQRQALAKHYAEIDQKAQCIFTVSERAKQLFPNNSNVNWVANGVDANHFRPDVVPHRLLSKIRKPIIGYHGVIEHRIDFNLVETVAKQIPEASFVFVGPVWKSADISSVQELPNVHFLGPVPYREMPGVIQAFDVGWIPHRVNAFTESMNPLKLLEFAAMEKPIVSTEVAGVNEFQPHIKVVSQAAEATEALRKGLKAGRVPPLREMVQQRSWDRITDNMLNLAGLQ